MSAPPAPLASGLTVTFWGAAQAVTGSMHLIEAGGRKVLLDCGLARGHHDAHLAPAGHFPFAPADLDAVIVSHAHIDHCGNLPGLVRQGFAGPVYCTAATGDLVDLMLHNSARVQEEDAFVRQVLTGPPGAEPTLSARHAADQVLRQCVVVPYDEPWEVVPGLQARLVNAGHILGSAMVALTARGSRGDVRLTFTGDLGRRGAPLVPDPAPLPAADLVLSESTYGGRVLAPVAEAITELEAVVRRTLERDGKVLVPAFSLGRTQVLAHVLEESMRSGRVPEVPVYVDSPLATDIAEVYRRHSEGLDEESARRARAGDFLAGWMVHYVREHEESKELSTRRGPCVIIAPGGMCEGGRILQHLKHHIDDPRCSVVLVNYQAPHTPGRRLLERGPTVRFHGRKWNKWADIVYLAGFSGHADHNDLLAYLGPLAGPAAKVCLVHGEPEQSQALRSDLLAAGFADVQVPGRGEAVRLD
jgi:metallo-beta-lactamase family protein